ncbi:pre-mRNA-splicing factor 38A-like [Tubulanus polymorphus]|uniref:pre-mRNA-splicing factor 38A-like n=1 Tax=Tubulanus polymorphus TaxID=672921 RepID=UPI003DA20910
MANRTVKDANSVKGTNPQYLIEKITRSRIYECRYWKEQCFALSAELLVDKAMELKYIGGVFGGNIKPTPFLCLVLKMLQIQPEKDIVVEFIRNADFKYVRALGAFYMRLVGTSLEIYKYLEPLYNDFRKLKKQNRDGSFVVCHMDEYIDDLLHEERNCDVILPRIQKRNVLEENNELEPRVSALEEDMDDMEDEEEDDEEINTREVASSNEKQKGRDRDWDRPRRSVSPVYTRGSSPRRRRSRSRDRHRDRGTRRSRSPRERRKRSRSPDRHRHDDDRHHHRKSSKHSHRDKDKKDKDKSHRSRDKGKSSKSVSSEDPEIKEANELRAKLGLAPLKL